MLKVLRVSPTSHRSRVADEHNEWALSLTFLNALKWETISHWIKHFKLLSSNANRIQMNLKVTKLVLMEFEKKTVFSNLWPQTWIKCTYYCNNNESYFPILYIHIICHSIACRDPFFINEWNMQISDRSNCAALWWRAVLSRSSWLIIQWHCSTRFDNNDDYVMQYVRTQICASELPELNFLLLLLFFWKKEKKKN